VNFNVQEFLRRPNIRASRVSVSHKEGINHKHGRNKGRPENANCQTQTSEVGEPFAMQPLNI
jgi:hypothetical protein